MMVRSLLLLLTLATLQAHQVTRLGASLRPGMELTYESNGTRSIWTIDSVDTEVRINAAVPCVKIVLRIGADARPQPRSHCVSGDTMMNWNRELDRLLPSRLLGPGTLTLPSTSGGSVRFDVEPGRTVDVGTRRVVVLPTVVTTTDSSGKVIRRLTETFAPELATAVGGVFEVPDPSLPGQWRTVQRFTLVSIKDP